MKISFASTVTLPSSKLHDDELAVEVVADLIPGDHGGLHCPPHGPIPEILTVIIDPMEDIDGTRYEHGEDVTLLLGEEDMIRLEDEAIEAALEAEEGMADQEPDLEQEDFGGE